MHRIPKVEVFQSNQAPQVQVSQNAPQGQGAAQMPSAKDEDKMPLFLIKLWNIVEDPAYREIIRWDSSGYSFHIVDPYSFCRNVLPHYFKHNNLNSLIRQLNMYGFRKMSPLDRGGLTRTESDQDHLEFSHACFIRDRPDLLVNIKRKQSAKNGDGTLAVQTQNNLHLVMDELRQLRDKQRNMDNKMHELTKENEALWEQMETVRNQHNRQQQVVAKLVQFLVAMVQPNLNKRVLKRGVLAIDETPAKRPRTSSSNANNTNNLTDMLDRLQRELIENGGFQQQQQHNYQQNKGPIIADVTDEWGSFVPSPENNIPDTIIYGSSDGQQYSNHASPGQRRTSAGSANTTSRPYHVSPRSQTSPMSATTMPSETKPSPMISQQRAPQTTCDPLSSRPSSSNALSVAQNQPMYQSTNQQHLSNANPSSPFNPTITMSPALERQISAELQSGLGLQEYLNGVDVNIDSCRDLLSGQWDFDFLENLEHDSPNNKPGHQLALEQGTSHDDTLAPFPDPLHQDFGGAGHLGNDIIFPATPELLTPSTSPRP